MKTGTSMYAIVVSYEAIAQSSWITWWEGRNPDKEAWERQFRL